MDDPISEPRPADEERAADEFNTRPSTFSPPRGIDLVGFGEEEFANNVGNEIWCILHTLGKVMDLQRLHRVLVAFDYTEALRTLDRGIETQGVLTPTKDDFAEGIAMTPSVIIDGEPRSIMVLNAIHISVLGVPDNQDLAEHYRRILHVLAHESGHVHDLEMQVRAFPGYILQRQLPYKDAVLFRFASGCWEEYIASRLSAFMGNEVTIKDLEFPLCGLLETARTKATAAIRQYRMHSNLDRVTAEVTDQYRKLLVYASYLLGHLDGIGASLQEAAPKTFDLVERTPYFKSFFERLHAQLKSMHGTYGEWSSFDIFRSLKDLAHELLKDGGIDIQERTEGFYIHIPLTPETTPSLSEMIKFKLSRPETLDPK